MEKVFISREVCELLAQQLVNEQAELVKQEAVVEGLTKTLKEKKMEIIRKRLEGKFFKLDDSKVTPIDVEFNEWKDGMWVRVIFAKEPASFLNDEATLTKKEKQLLNQYKKAFKRCRWGFNEEACHEIQDLARKLCQLKHGFILTDWRVWDFNFEDFSSRDFFRNSGLYLDNMSRYDDSILIENLKY